MSGLRVQRVPRRLVARLAGTHGVEGMIAMLRVLGSAGPIELRPRRTLNPRPGAIAALSESSEPGIEARIR